MILLRLIKEGEIRLAVLAMVVLLLVAAIVNLAIGIRMLPGLEVQPEGGTMSDLEGAEAAAKGWPSTTPHETPWPPPNSWRQQRWPGLWLYWVDSSNPSDPEGSGFAMSLIQSGWPWPVIERKRMWWDWDDPLLMGPESKPATQILFGGLALNTVILGSGLWLILLGPLALFVIGRRVARTLHGCCAFCGSGMAGLMECSACAWPTNRQDRTGQ
jgi:hypothetical protein